MNIVFCSIFHWSIPPINTFTMQTKHLLNQYFNWEIPSYWTSDGGYHNDDDAQDASLYAIAPTGIASPFLILTRCNIWMVLHFSYERYQYRCWAYWELGVYKSGGVEDVFKTLLPPVLVTMVCLSNAKCTWILHFTTHS